MPVMSEKEIKYASQIIEQFKPVEIKIHERITEIIKIFYKCYKIDKFYIFWEYQDKPPLQEMRTLAQAWNEGVICLNCGRLTSEIDVELFPPEMTDLPVSWLTTSDFEIEEKILNFIELCRKEKLAQAEARAQARAEKKKEQIEKNNLKLQALAKLTEEEIQALFPKRK